MSDETDIQRFEKDGIWVKPERAGRVQVELKGGTGGSSRSGGIGGRGGDPTFALAIGLSAGGGGGGGASSAASEWKAALGGEGGRVVVSFAADALPDQVAVKVGQPDGYALITTYRTPPAG